MFVGTCGGDVKLIWCIGESWGPEPESKGFEFGIPLWPCCCGGNGFPGIDDGGMFPTTGTPGGGAWGMTLELTTPGRKMGVEDSPSAMVVVLQKEVKTDVRVRKE